MLLSVALATMAAGCCFFGSSWLPSSPVEQQRQWARSFEPEELDRAQGPGAARRLGVLRVRAYLDSEPSTGSGDAEGAVRRTIDDASRLLAAQLGAALELVDVRTFSPSATDLPVVLDDLKARDASIDVDLVIGFLRAAPLVTSSHHALGIADVLGHHAVVRLLDDVRELRAIETVLNRLPESERSDLFERRRRHKAAVVLVHEIAHDLGAVHGGDPNGVNFPSYSIEQSRVDDDAVAMLEIGIEWLRANDTDRPALASRLAALLRSQRDRLDARGLDEVIASLERRAAGSKPAPPVAAIVLAPDDARLLNEAVERARAGDHAGAWQLLAPLASRPDAHPRVLALACLVASMDGVVALDGKARCDRALAATPEDIEPVVGAIAFATRADDRDGEARAWEEAAARLGRLTPPAARIVVDLADLAVRRRRYSIAEDALSLAPPGDERLSALRAQVTTERRRVGIRRGAVAVAEEAAVADVVLAIERATDTSGASKMADEAIRRYGEVAGLLAARCGALWRAHKLTEAEKVCAAALAKDEEAAVGHVFTGILHAERGRPERAVVELERALQLDPETKATWTVLGAVLRSSNRIAALRALDARYRERFGAALP